ncbi:hypothetical protein CCY99_03870 [Helicobacter sp. 16-1353]|uniref:aldo/keto reductase family protein n=1 Tax=Helicobacter sp. 16-1353 TaxID=2004996 RepID=UPI000DCCBE67|nr:aldo/keto reductase [Helicobacter sp. 16-1353]RAX54495.1 hypothetical protein CCY99_03870 [Helicobacter sp. 16-1353]
MENRRAFLKNTTFLAGGMMIFGANNIFASNANAINTNKGGSMGYITLNNGVKMPNMGFGTWNLRADEAKATILEALNVGYRLIDTASYYRNEKEIGEAVREFMAKSGVKREEIFITTKVFEDNAEAEFTRSMKNLDLGYIDLYLIHWPKGSDKKRWEVLQKHYKSGEIRAIGVSNYDISEIENLMKTSDTKPALNQIRINPFSRDKATIEYCKAQNIAVQAYTSLGNLSVALKNKTLQEIAKKYNKSIPQIMLRWALQQDFIPIPKSSNPKRIRENFDIFDFSLSSDDMAKISSIS